MDRIRIADVAKAAGVSSATVSLVLNDAASRISEATKTRVRQVAGEVGYSPNPIARSLRTRVTGTVGLVADRIATTPFAGRMLAGAQEVARENGQLVILVDTDGHPEVESDAVAMLVNHRVDALIYASMYHRVIACPPGITDDTVFLDCRTEGDSHRAVVPDDYRGGRAATRELIDAGHRRIAFIDTNELERPVAADLRYRGYQHALVEAGLRPDPELHVAAATSAVGGRRAMEQLNELSTDKQPSAVFAYNDRIAAGVVMWAHRAGVSIPRDLSLIGYDDQQLVAAELDPPLTTVSLPHAAMGRWAMEVALGLREADTNSPHLMDCPIVRRASVGPPAHLGSAREPRVAVNHRFGGPHGDSDVVTQ